MKKLLFFCCLLTIWTCDNETKVDQSSTASVDIPTIAEDAPIPGTAVTQEQLDNMRPNANAPAPDFVLKRVNFQDEINPTMVAKGKKVFETKKCGECHSLTADGGTATSFVNMFSRHKPVWVMNMTRNVDVEVGDAKNCPTRAETSKLTFIQSRDLLELIRSLNK